MSHWVSPIASSDARSRSLAIQEHADFPGKLWQRCMKNMHGRRITLKRLEHQMQATGSDGVGRLIVQQSYKPQVCLRGIDSRAGAVNNQSDLNEEQLSQTLVSARLLALPC